MSREILIKFFASMEPEGVFSSPSRRLACPAASGGPPRCKLYPKTTTIPDWGSSSCGRFSGRPIAAWTALPAVCRGRTLLFPPQRRYSPPSDLAPPFINAPGQARPGAWGKLFGEGFAVTLQDGGNLRPGRRTLGGQSSFHALQQPLLHGPGHGRHGVAADAGCVGIAGQVARDGNLFPGELSVTRQEGNQLLPGYGGVGGEDRIGQALSDSGLIGPGHGLGVIPAAGDVGEGRRPFALRLTGQAVQDGHDLAPGQDSLGSELCIAHALH